MLSFFSFSLWSFPQTSPLVLYNPIILSAASASSLLSFNSLSTSAFGNRIFTRVAPDLDPDPDPDPSLSPPPSSANTLFGFMIVRSEADRRANIKLSSLSFALMLIADRTRRGAYVKKNSANITLN